MRRHGQRHTAGVGAGGSAGPGDGEQVACRRPFLVMTRSAAIPVLHSVVAAPVSRTIRGIASEVNLGPEDGMPVECAASFDNVRMVPRSNLTSRLCALGSVLWPKPVTPFA